MLLRSNLSERSFRTKPRLARSHRTPARALARRRITLEPLEPRRVLAITVNTVVDELDGDIGDGDISLRDAIAAAPPGETIAFDQSLAGQTITLTLGELHVTEPIQIEGLGSGQLTISADDASRVFLFDDADGTTQFESEVHGLRLSGGNADGSTAFTGRGGAIYTQERLSLRDVVIADSTATEVGGAVAALARLTVVDSTIIGNSAAQGGGGIWVGGVGTTMESSTVTGNYAPMGGGMLVSVDAFTRVVNSTFSGNSADRGGGVFVAIGDLALSYSTIASNSAKTSGGGIATSNFISHVGIDHTIIAANSADMAADLDFDFPLMDQTTTFSLIGDNSGTAIAEAQLPNANGNLVGSPIGGGVIDPGLAPLGNNGGPTQTHALLAVSPALDAGDPHIDGGHIVVPQFDQRNALFQRIVDGNGDGIARIDMGALESQMILGCDLDGDNDCEIDDIDALVTTIVAATNLPQFDLTGDGLVDLHDRDAWLVAAGEHNLGPGRSYLLGDANLDGVVDGRDFLLWNAHKFTHVAAWSAGDFDASGVVDGHDFVIWNMHRFQGNEESQTDGKWPWRTTVSLPIT